MKRTIDASQKQTTSPGEEEKLIKSEELQNDSKRSCSPKLLPVLALVLLSLYFVSNTFFRDSYAYKLGVAVEVEKVEKHEIHREFKKVEDKYREILRCYHRCSLPSEDLLTLSRSNEYSFEALEEHHRELIQVTQPFRPRERSNPVLFRDYYGPLMEDHFIHNLIGEDYASFFPLVPIFVHWRETEYSHEPSTNYTTLWQILKPKLRKDVVYFTVVSATGRTLKLWEKMEQENFKVIRANPRGSPADHIILPHLFTYQVPGYDRDSNSLYNNTAYEHLKRDVIEAPTESLVLSSSNSSRQKGSKYDFKNYYEFLKSPYFDQNVSSHNITLFDGSKFPKTVPISLVGHLKTKKSRRTLDKMMRSDLGSRYMQRYVEPLKVCTDYSTKTSTSPCWRVLMLASDLTVAPFGFAPVSFKLYEAIQMGVPPVYIYDERGAFIPYEGTRADLRNFSLVLSMKNAPEKLKEILGDGLYLEKLRSMRKALFEVRDSYFTPNGVVKQLKRWLKNPKSRGSDGLQCCVDAFHA